MKIAYFGRDLEISSESLDFFVFFLDLLFLAPSSSSSYNSWFTSSSLSNKKNRIEFGKKMETLCTFWIIGSFLAYLNDKPSNLCFLHNSKSN